MKILFITTKSQSNQGDYLELSILHGLKVLLGENLIEIPKKNILYGDFTKVKKEDLHGRGFTLLNDKFEDNVNRTDLKNIDFVIYGSGHAYGEEYFIEKYDKLAKYNSWIIDGHDLYGKAKKMKKYRGEYVIGNQFEYSFKRELIFEQEHVYPSGFGIPESVIKEVNFKKKNKLFQKTAPMHALFKKQSDLGGTRNHHIFDNENDYFEDISSSWFGITSKKGGWDTLRHYEIIAAGTLLLFRDYDKKPNLCSPQDLPCFSYSTKKELLSLIDNLVINNKPSIEYEEMLKKQRNWLIENGTTVARAKKIVKVLSSYKN
jgi:hypothetical protein